jgi:hypothetical protein
MKFFWTVISLLTALILIAQEVLNRTWFLTDLIVNGENITVPNEAGQDGFPTLSTLVNDA